MQHSVSFCVVVVAALSQATAIAQARDYEAEAENAIGAAKKAAGFEHLGLLNRLCVLPPSVRPRTSDTVPGYVTDPSTAPPRDRWYADATQVFDDLYWLGGSIHSAWLLTTAAGHILIDTEFPYNSEVLILEGMRKFGFDPGTSATSSFRTHMAIISAVCRSCRRQAGQPSSWARRTGISCSGFRIAMPP